MDKESIHFTRCITGDQILQHHSSQEELFVENIKRLAGEVLTAQLNKLEKEPATFNERFEIRLSIYRSEYKWI